MGDPLTTRFHPGAKTTHAESRRRSNSLAKIQAGSDIYTTSGQGQLPLVIDLNASSNSKLEPGTEWPPQGLPPLAPVTYEDVRGWDTLIPYYITDHDMYSRLLMRG